MSKKLFVGNLPFEVNDADLHTVLAVAGEVVEAKVIVNTKTGRSKGYGFVEMKTEEMADLAVKKFEGATLNERALTVQLATPKQEATAKKDASEGSSPAIAEPGSDAAPELAAAVSENAHANHAPAQSTPTSEASPNVE